MMNLLRRIIHCRCVNAAWHLRAAGPPRRRQDHLRPSAAIDKANRSERNHPLELQEVFQIVIVISQFSPRICAGFFLRSTCPLTTRYSALSRVSIASPQ